MAFALGAMLLSIILAGTTFALTRANLLSQRESAVLSRVYVDANVVKNGLQGRDLEHIQDQLLPSLQLPAGSRPLVLFRGRGCLQRQRPQISDKTVIPPSLSKTVRGGHAARMTFSLQGKPALAVGIPIPGGRRGVLRARRARRPAADARVARHLLLGASVFTTLAGAGIGFWAGRRALRPLADVSQAAEAIAGGRLDTRLEATDDPHLGVLANFVQRDGASAPRPHRARRALRVRREP